MKINIYFQTKKFLLFQFSIFYIIIIPVWGYQVLFHVGSMKLRKRSTKLLIFSLSSILRPTQLLGRVEKHPSEEHARRGTWIMNCPTDFTSSSMFLRQDCTERPLFRDLWRFHGITFWGTQVDLCEMSLAEFSLHFHRSRFSKTDVTFVLKNGSQVVEPTVY